MSLRETWLYSTYIIAKAIFIPCEIELSNVQWFCSKRGPCLLLPKKKKKKNLKFHTKCFFRTTGQILINLNWHNNSCLFDWSLSSHFRIFHSYGDITITGEGLQTLTFAQHSWPLSSEI